MTNSFFFQPAEKKASPLLSSLFFLCLLFLLDPFLGAEAIREPPLSSGGMLFPDGGMGADGGPFPGRPLRQYGATDARPDRFSSRGGEVLPSIPGIDRELTKRYIRQYSNPEGIKWLNAVMKQGGPYLAFIREEIARQELPPELIYLPVIESGYQASAKSRAGAAGLWQFMQNSMVPFDMRVTDLLDERMDFWKSTVGALRKLKENYEYFKNWPLALAAYNAGLGAIRRAVSQTGISDYWILSERKQFKTETIHYVPKLLAVSYILSNPRRFGLDPLWTEDPRWTRVTVGRTVDLELLAKEAGVNAETLKWANRELLHRITPPDPQYALKVPAAYAEAIAKTLAREDLTLIDYYIYAIKSGDTLSALARHYGVSVAQILSFNPGVRANSLRIGSNLLIPAIKTVGPYQRQAGVPGGTPDVPSSEFTGTHLVKRGETLWSIARAYNVAPEALARANDMSLNDILREGRTLKTPIR